jgi:hypothetical protein
MTHVGARQRTVRSELGGKDDLAVVPQFDLSRTQGKIVVVRLHARIVGRDRDDSIVLPLLELQGQRAAQARLLGLPGPLPDALEIGRDDLAGAHGLHVDVATGGADHERERGEERQVAHGQLG